MAAKIQFFGRAQFGDSQCLLDVQGAGLAVRPHSAIVVDPVGDVGILLHLRNDDALADGVQGSCRDEEHIALFHRHRIEYFGQRVFPDALGKFLFGNFMGKAVVQEGTRLGVQHIPHLGLAVLALVLQRVGVGGMHLNGQIVFCVNELGENGKLLEFPAVGTGGLRVGGKVIRQCGAVLQIGRPVRVRGQHPRLGQRVQVALHTKLGFQTLAAPQVILTAGFQSHDRHRIPPPTLRFVSAPGTGFHPPL